MSDQRLRSYALTGGRARSEAELPLETPITVGSGPRPARGLPEHHEILQHCSRPQTLVDLSSATGSPVGVLRVLVLDLAEQGALVLHRQDLRLLPPHRDIDLLEEALHGIANL